MRDIQGLHNLARKDMQTSIQLAGQIGEILNNAKDAFEQNGERLSKLTIESINTLHARAMFIKSCAEKNAFIALSLDSNCIWAKQVIDGLGQLFGDSETMQ